MDFKRRVLTLTLLFLLSSISGGILVSGHSKNGTFTFTLYGYTVTGELTDAVITHEGTVRLQMSFDMIIPIPNGTVHAVGNGVWDGSTDFAMFSGSIGNVKGSVQICLLGLCQSADFTGSGSWTGILTWSRTAGSQGAGTFQGTLNSAETNSTMPNPVSVAGNWTAGFAI